MGTFAGLVTLAQIAAPGAPTAALAGAGAGNVDNGAHSYKITFVASATETEAGTKSNAVTVVDKATNGKVALTAIPVSTDASVTSRKVYRTAAGADPNVAANYKLAATIADNTTTTLTDNLADVGLGAIAPTTNNTIPTTFPVPLSQTLASAGMTQSDGLAYLLVAEAGAGNLVISNSSTIAAEANGYPIGDNTNPLLMTIGGSQNDVIQAGALYLYSVTAGKQAYIIARSK